MRRPDIAIPLPSFAKPFVARDVSLAAFYYGYEAEGAARVAWENALLTRVIVTPRLTPELVQRLGDDRETLLDRYYQVIGAKPFDGEWSPAYVPRRGLDLTPPQALVALPPREILAQLKAAAQGLNRLPAELWTLPTSVWFFSIRALTDGERASASDDLLAMVPDS